MYNKYYQDELSYLREMGVEFSKAYPDAAHFVGEASGDPDVERLMEGFAFLTARLRQKLDDEFPELTHALVEMFWPHYLRPIPSFSILQFEALAQAAREVRLVARGTEVESIPVDETPCKFRTGYDVRLFPVVLESAAVKADAPPHLALRFRPAAGATLKDLDLSGLRLHLSGDAAVTRSLYLCLCRYLKRISVQRSGGPRTPVEGARVRPVGFRAEEVLLPFPAASFPGFRLLHEYFAFPSKYMFVDLEGMKGAPLGDSGSFDLVFELTRLPSSMPPVTAANFLLNCTPGVNLFRHEGEPIRLDHERVEYRVKPAGSKVEHYEVYTLDTVTGLESGTGKAYEYRPLLRFAQTQGGGGRFYRHRLHPSLTGDAAEVFLSPLPPEQLGEAPPIETLSVELTCTNRQLPTKLKVGDISSPTSSSPTFAKFRNLTRPTPSVPAPLGGDLHWRLLSHLAVNYLSLVNLEALRAVLGLYNFRARSDRQAEHSLRLMLDGIKGITASPSTRLLGGSPVRGLTVEVEVDEESFGGEGEAYLFGSLLDEFFAQYVTINAFCRLTVKGIKFGEIHQWPARVGDRIAL